MAELSKKGMISEMEALLSISGQEWLEVIALGADGDWHNFKLQVSKIRNNAGLSAYEIAVQNGFVGTVDQWLESLKGQSAYELWISLGNTGTEADFIATLKGAPGVNGKSAYESWLSAGNTGTENEFVKSLIGPSAYQAWLDAGNTGDEAKFLDSLKGKSAYQSWLDLGNTGTEGAFITSLKGEAGVDGTNGKDGTNGTNGKDGASTYQIWLDAGNTGTEEEFLESLKGTDGESAYQIWIDAGNTGTEVEFLASLKGADGTDGKTAYEIAKELNPAVGTEAEWVASLNGKSAYQVWLDAGNTGDEAAFILAITGKNGKDGTNGTDGENGKSNYQLWLDEGNTGTFDQFLLTLKGPQGEDGKDGTNGTDGENGKSAFEVWQALPGNAGKTEAEYIVAITGKAGVSLNIVATVSQEQFDEIVAEGDSEINDSYFVGEFIYVWNGEEWIKSNALRGPEGHGLNLLGTWPDAVALPLDPNYVSGDTYVWKKSLWSLVEKPTRQWVDVGTPGPEGKSAYQVWLDAGNVGTVQQYFDSLQGPPGKDGTNGKDGEIGPDGKSAYQVWLALPGNAGKTEAEYVLAITGPQGQPAVAFTIVDTLTNVSELPRPGNPSEAYYVGKDLYVWLDSKTDWENFGSLNGESAYQIWLDEGNTGSPADFLNSLKGKDGTNGTNGTDGENGDSAYQIWLSAGNTGTEAEFLASLKGADGKDGTNGTDGADGESAYQIWLDAGNVGDEAAFLASLKGVDGRNLEVLGSYPTSAEIIASPDPKEQDAYTADDTGHLWIYVAGTWVDAGRFRGLDGTNGKDGTNGTDGTDGKSAYETYKELPGNADKTEAEFIASLEGQSAFDAYKSLPGNENKTEAEFIESLKGAAGKDGTNGVDGKDGTNGRNVVVKGSVATKADLPLLPAEQDAYTVRDTGNLWMFIGADYVDLGQFRGDKGEPGKDGEQGEEGRSINILGQVDLLTELPPPGGLKIADAWFVMEDHKLYVVNDALVYSPGISIQGPQGEEGIEGPEGKQGTSIRIMGSYATEAALIADHPTGVAGDGYLVGNDLYLYGVVPGSEPAETKWFNAGPVRGPIGLEGPRGKTGLKGEIGLTGERGSLWLDLPDNVVFPTPDYGRDGDWAVSKSFDTFYKAPGTGWTQIGRLVAGDVNSPAMSLGKVVRLGTEWVPLLVDEVVSPVANVVYGRKLIDDGEGKLQWVPVPTGIVDLTAKDGKMMARIWEASAEAPTWKEIVLPAEGIPEAPTTAGKLWLRDGAGKAWIEYTGISGPTGAGKFMRTATDWAVFNQYDCATLSSNTAFNVASGQTLILDTSAARSVAFSNLPASGRSTVLACVATGTTLPTFTFPAGFTGTVKWNGGVDPVLLAGANIITLFMLVQGTTVTVYAAVGMQFPS